MTTKSTPPQASLAKGLPFSGLIGVFRVIVGDCRCLLWAALSAAYAIGRGAHRHRFSEAGVGICPFSQGALWPPLIDDAPYSFLSRLLGRRSWMLLAQVVIAMLCWVAFY